MWLADCKGRATDPMITIGLCTRYPILGGAVCEGKDEGEDWEQFKAGGVKSHRPFENALILHSTKYAPPSSTPPRCGLAAPPLICILLKGKLSQIITCSKLPLHCQIRQVFAGLMWFEVRNHLQMHYNLTSWAQIEAKQLVGVCKRVNKSHTAVQGRSILFSLLLPVLI